MPRGKAAYTASAVQQIVDDVALLRSHRDAAFVRGDKEIGQAYERAIREFYTGAILGLANQVTGVNGAIRS